MTELTTQEQLQDEMVADANRMMAEMAARMEETLRESIPGVQANIKEWGRILSFLEKKRDRDVRRLERLEKELVEIEQGKLFSIPSGKARLVSGRPRMRFEGMTFAEAAATILKDAGTPLHVNTLWNRMSEGGIKSRAKKPKHSLVAVLHRYKQFVALGGNVFELKEAVEAE